ncbi:MAG: YtxH domain-containing protein [Syntrophales bacterium]|jgi:gas vesicle protein|nr:YtxH domain-containing protein [Syntrophales bacterium]MDY0044251.1 YtxH domain-containing protein [Syntrophales bacterium]
MTDKDIVQEKSNHNNSGFRYFLLGGVLAASAALLLAPKSGRETREYLTTKAREGKDYIYKEAHQAEEKFLSGKDKIRSEAKEILSRAREITKKEKFIVLEAIEAGKEAYRTERDSYLQREKSQPSAQ